MLTRTSGKTFRIIAQEWHGYFSHVRLICPPSSATILKLRAQPNYNSNILEAFNIYHSGQKIDFHVNPYMGYLFLELPECPEFMECNITSFGRHQKILCHKNRETGFIWNHNEDPALVISPRRLTTLTLTRADLEAWTDWVWPPGSRSSNQAKAAQPQLYVSGRYSGLDVGLDHCQYLWAE